MLLELQSSLSFKYSPFVDTNLTGVANFKSHCLNAGFISVIDLVSSIIVEYLAHKFNCFMFPSFGFVVVVGGVNAKKKVPVFLSNF